MAVGCGAKCAKFLLIIFNIIFWLSGCALMVVGILLVLEKNNRTLLDLLEIGEEEPLLRIAAYFFIGVGAFVFIVGFFGCCGAIQEIKSCLVIYFLLLFIILAAEVAAAVLAVVYKSDLEQSLKKNLKESLAEKYDGDPRNSVTVFWDNAQRQFACCGVTGPEDYLDAVTWHNASTDFVPRSCCRLTLDSTPERPVYDNLEVCMQHNNNPQRYEKGCYSEVEKWLRDNSTLIIGVGIGIACLEIFGMIFAICLCRNINRDS